MRRNMMQNKQNRRKQVQTSFKPSRDEIEQATRDFLNHGGKITKVIDLSEEYEDFVNFRDSIPPADEFLLGR